MYFRARYFCPIMGRFLQTDPMGYKDSLNLYQSFNQNPVNFVDPMGEEIGVRLKLKNGFYLDTITGWGQEKIQNKGYPIQISENETIFVDFSDTFNKEIKWGRIITTQEGFRIELTLQEAYAVAQVINMGLDFVPIVGTIKGIVEAYYGYDFVGNNLELWERFLSIPGVTDAILSSYKIISKGSKYIDNVLPLDSIKFKGEVFRYNDPKYMKSAWDIHPGNIKSSHRYSRSGEGALYTSLDPSTAFKEVGEDITYWLTSKKRKFEGICDLTDPKIRKKLGVTYDDIASPDYYSVTHKIGDLLRKKGYKGILVPSAQRRGGINLVLFNKLK